MKTQIIITGTDDKNVCNILIYNPEGLTEKTLKEAVEAWLSNLDVTGGAVDGGNQT